MTEKIKISDNIANKKSAFVRKVCKVLFEKTHITYFCYLRRYQDGSFMFLPSAIDFGQLLFEDGYYPDSWFAGVPFEKFKTGYTFWDLAKQVSSEQTNAFAEKLIKSFQLVYGIEIVEKYSQYCDFYSFSGNKPDIYYIPLDFLYRFIFFFKQECQTLLLEADTNRLQLLNKEFLVAPMPIITNKIDVESKAASSFKVNRYYLSGDHSGAFITDRELEILQKTEEGYSTKLIADFLNISPRTVEHHITNVRSKLNVSRTTEILHIVRQQQLLI